MAAVRDPEWFGQVVRHAGSLAGHSTQAGLAEAAGLSLNTVVNVVTGARGSYRPATLASLANGLGIDPGRLLACATTGTGNRPRGMGAAAPGGAGSWVGVAAVDAAARLATPAGLEDVPGSGAVFVVSVQGVDASVVEQALAATLARLGTRHPHARSTVRPLA
ncbi:MAG: helix-turn-helix domain-containing protein [Actinomycetota bacterium]|nr:helix-turn-helix domain-containing protein [Actinomycetota bacterium]